MGQEGKQSQYSEVLCNILTNVLVSVYIITVYVSEELFVSLPSLLFVVPLHAPAQTGPN